MFFFSASKSRAMRLSCSSIGLLALGDNAALLALGDDAALLALEDDGAADDSHS